MASKAPRLDGHRILVVEDDYLIAQVLVDMLEEAGAEVVGPFGWVEDTIAFLGKDEGSLSSAVLDVNLHGSKSYPIADVLISRAVRIVFVTGYGTGVIDSRYADHPRCGKPFNETAVIAALAGA